MAEVERIWSMAKHVLTVQKCLMTPQFCEALVFLKFNERFWNVQLDFKATKCARSERVEELAKSHDAFEMELGEDQEYVVIFLIE